jgi:hypothetical protein
MAKRKGDSWLNVPWGYSVSFCLQTLIRSSVTCSKNRLSSNQWILHLVLKLKHIALSTMPNVIGCSSEKTRVLEQWHLP